MNSTFPGNIKDMWLTYFHKRGICMNILNYWGVMLLNFLANSPTTWLIHKLIPYVARLKIIPETQVATNQGVQTRDVMSFLSGVMCNSDRNEQPVYALQRDQVKGFDYLLPSGFYNAMKAYSCPDSIRKLDEAAQEKTKAFGHTASVATVMTDVFQKNIIMVSIKLLKP